MKILLTGANGQVGREIIAQALSPIELLAFTKAELDITDWQQVKTVVDCYQPQLVINAAAYTAVDRAEQESTQAFAVNSEGVKNIAQICRIYDLPLLHLSTDYVFDGQKKGAYIEDDPHVPLNIYGASKAAGEKILQETWEKHIILRVSWVFGRYGHNFVKTILRLATQQAELKIVADQWGFPTAASDLASTLLVLANRVFYGQPQWGIFHYRGNQSVSWFDFAKIILQEAKHFSPLYCSKLQPITTAAFPTPAKRPQNCLLDVRKIETVYGILPGDWKKSLQEILNLLMSNNVDTPGTCAVTLMRS